MTTAGIYSDLELFELIKTGDEAAFTEIYHRYFDLLYLHALKRVRNGDIAKDLIQELFTTLWTKRDTLYARTNLSNYLYTATRNGVFTYIARQKLETRYISTLPSLELTGECLTDHLSRERQLAAIIEKEIDELPEKMGMIFKLSRKDGLSHKEIAEMLNLSELTVKTQVKNALRILRVKLGMVVYLYMLLNHR